MSSHLRLLCLTLAVACGDGVGIDETPAGATGAGTGDATATAASTGTGTGTGTGDAGPTPSSRLVVEDADNADITATFTVPRTEVQEGFDVVFDWSGLETDILGSPVDPAAVELVGLYAFTEPAADILDRFARAALDHFDAEEAWWGSTGGATSLRLSDLSITGHAFNPSALRADRGLTWLVMLQDDDQTLMSGAILSPGGSEQTVRFTNAARLTFTATLAAPLATGSDLSPWSFDWSALTEDAHGNAFDPVDGQRLFVAGVPDGAGALADRAFTVDAIADPWFVSYVEGKDSLPADELVALSGDPFSGFTADRLWVLGIRCISCLSPAPQVLVPIQVVR